MIAVMSADFHEHPDERFGHEDVSGCVPWLSGVGNKLKGDFQATTQPGRQDACLVSDTLQNSRLVQVYDHAL
jgi:hypothetical protein